MRGNPPKVTEAQRQEILRAYREEGTKAAEALCISLGLSGRYFSPLASATFCGVTTRGMPSGTARPSII